MPDYLARILILMLFYVGSVAQGATSPLVEKSSWTVTLNVSDNESFRFAEFIVEGQSVFFIEFNRGRRIVAQQSVTQRTWLRWKNGMKKASLALNPSSCQSPVSWKSVVNGKVSTEKGCPSKATMTTLNQTVVQMSEHLFPVRRKK